MRREASRVNVQCLGQDRARREVLARIIDEVVEPAAAAVDRHGVFPRAAVDALGKAGGLVSARDARAATVRVLVGPTDPGAVKGTETYIGWIDHLVDAIAKALAED